MPDKGKGMGLGAEVGGKVRKVRKVGAEVGGAVINICTKPFPELEA